jgi:hypothetical protein
MNGKDFEELETLKEFCDKYGDYRISYEDIKEYNIQLIISSNQEIEFKILCSNALSEIIRIENKLPKNLLEYKVLRITENNRSYIRVSQSRTIEADSNLSFWENMEMAKKLPGNISVSFKVEDIKPEPLKLINIDDLIKR